MLPVTEAFKNAFEANDFECDVIEGDNGDQVQMLVNSEVFGPRFLVVEFPNQGGYVSARLPLIEIPKGKSHVAVTTANDLQRTAHLVRFWADKKKHAVWAIADTLVQEADAVAMTSDTIVHLINYCGRVYEVFEKAMNPG
jgi:hypothetical protein